MIITNYHYTKRRIDIPMEQTLVSIIIRTCGKTSILKNALDSVVRQSYPNIEVVIIEDGQNISEQFIRSNYPHLNCHYYYTGKRTGRTHAGNLGLQYATGQYFNFLDEDDILLPEHVSLLVKALTEEPYKVAYSVAREDQIHIKSTEPYIFQVKRSLIRYNHPFNRLLLCYMNLFPIQSVMFDRTLYEQYGGFDETLDVLEDWDLWLRYSMHCDFLRISAITSVYYTPFKSKKKQKREIALHSADEQLAVRRSAYRITLDANQISNDMDYIVNVFNKKSIWFYLQKVRNYLLYRDR